MRAVIAIVVVAACGSSHPGAAPDGGGPAADARLADAPLADAPLADARAIDAATSDAAPDAFVHPPDGIAHFAVNGEGICAIHNDGALWCWGSAVPPARIGTSNGWTAITRDWRTCGIDGGTLYCWSPGAAPKRVEGHSGWTAISTQGATTCGLSGGALFCGDALDQRVGTGDDWTSIVVGNEYQCGTRAPGTLWCWGAGFQGRTGTGSEAATTAPVQIGTATTWTALALDGPETCGLRGDGTRWCWGGEYGLAPMQADADTGWSAISKASPHHRCGIDHGGVVCEGDYDGGVGDGTQTPRTSFVQVGTGVGWRDVSAGATSCAIDARDALWCWGSRWGGIMLDGLDAQKAVMTRIGTGTGWTKIVATDGPSFAQTCGLEGDAIYCWGEAGDIGLGDGTRTPHELPTLVGTGYVDVALGTTAACGRKVDGTLWCWGKGSTIGTSFDQLVPVQIGTATDWSAIAVGDDICGIRAGGLYCFGQGPAQAVDGAFVAHTVPTRGGTDADWTAVSTFGQFSCGLRNGGEPWCWGLGHSALTSSPTRWNDSDPSARLASMIVRSWSDSPIGLLADGRLWTDRYIDPSTWLELGNNTCAIATDHTLQCEDGQVGTGTDWVHVGGSSFDTFAMTPDGELWGFGQNFGGELGTGDAFALSPVRVAP